MRHDILQQALNEEEYLEVNIRCHIAQAFREDLERAGFITSRQLREKKNGDYVKIAGRVILVQMPPTRSGIRIMFITIEDEHGLIDMVMFPDEQKQYAKKVLENLIVLCEGEVRKLGKKDVSMIIKRVRSVTEFYGKDPDKNHTSCHSA